LRELEIVWHVENILTASESHITDQVRSEIICVGGRSRVDYRLQLYGSQGQNYYINLICDGVNTGQHERALFYLIASIGDGNDYRYQTRNIEVSHTTTVFHMKLERVLLISRFGLEEDSDITSRGIIVRNGFVSTRIFELFPMMDQPPLRELEIVWHVENILTASESHFTDQVRSEIIRVGGISRIDYRPQLYGSGGSNYSINLTCNGVNSGQREPITFELVASIGDENDYHYGVTQFVFTHTKTAHRIALKRRLLIDRFGLDEDSAITFSCTIFR